MAHKVVVNSCYGGASLSDAAIKLGREISGNPEWMKKTYHLDSVSRHDPILVKVVEMLGADASGPYANLEVELIDCNMYRIDEYDGYETVVTPGNQIWVLIEDDEDAE